MASGERRVQSVGLALVWLSIVHGQIVGPPDEYQNFKIPHPAGMTASDYPVDGQTVCDLCRWTSPHGAFYDLSLICEEKYEVGLSNPRGSRLRFGVCQIVECDATNTLGCVHVPGNAPTSTGRSLQFEQIEPNIPSAGVRVTLIDGDVCIITRNPRKTIIDLKCDPSLPVTAEIFPSQGWEGEGSSGICNYYVQFPSPHGCPTHANKYSNKLQPLITAVSGCVDSTPKLSTSECKPSGGPDLYIYGLDFGNEYNIVEDVTVMVGATECTHAKLHSPWMIQCQLPAGTGDGHVVHLSLKIKSQVKISPEADEAAVTEAEAVHVTSHTATVSYKPLVDYKRHFDNFMDLGVGGLSKQIRELYQRAFASRSIPGSVLKQLGIEHAKGILLYGPPGSGKTLLARCIAKILKTDQVKLINAPEIMSKYLGESEKNLRGYFSEAEQAWLEQGENSDLYIIIIDEIDAICKPRGKSDTSAAAAAYDSIVNQLLTKMDGLKEVGNLLVIGLTNRPELIDPALKRPGRFEIQVEIGLPDEEGRWEIFYIHTRTMKENGYLADDVDLHELARRSAQFSGAEIAGVIRLAASYAVDRKYGNSSNAHSQLLVQWDDFLHAFEHFKPAFTEKQEDILEEFVPRGYIQCGETHEYIIGEIMRTVAVLEQRQYSSVETVLLHGPRGVGKTALAAYVASMSNFTFVKVISAQNLLRHGVLGRVDIVMEAFYDAYKADFGLIILDDLHHITEVIHIQEATHASMQMLHTLQTLLTSQPPKGCKLLVIGTLWTLSEEIGNFYTGDVHMQDFFTSTYYLPRLNITAAEQLLKQLGYLDSDGDILRLEGAQDFSLRDLFGAVDCIDMKLQKAELSRQNTSVNFLTECNLINR